jgi:hypothetical protein
MGTRVSALQTDRTYRFVGLNPYFMLGVLVLLTLVAPAMLVKFVQSGGWYYVVWVAILAWFWFIALFRFAYRIRVNGNAAEFKTIARRRRTPLAQIRSIHARSTGYVIIRFDGGRVELAGAFNDFHDFVNRVKEANPGVELKGV